MANKTVKKIEATKPTLSAQYSTFTRKRKVAAYARVSTAKEEQENSFEAQVSYYTQKIRANPEWVFVEVYSDEGITGTNTKKRDGFNRMIEDALAGKIDLILTKSVSRFARNTVDSLVTIRQLKEIDVVTELTKRCIAENSQTAQNQEEYAARYNGFVERYEKAKARLEQLRTTKAAREAQAEAIGAFMFEMQELDTLTEFDEKLWLTTIDTVTVHADGRMTFKFQGGTEIEG